MSFSPGETMQLRFSTAKRGLIRRVLLGANIPPLWDSSGLSYGRNPIGYKSMKALCFIPDVLEHCCAICPKVDVLRSTLNMLSFLRSSSHPTHCIWYVCGIWSSQPKLNLQRFCSINLADRVKSARKPMGSYTELTMDKIPRLVGGLSSIASLNLKVSVSWPAVAGPFYQLKSSQVAYRWQVSH